MVEPMMFTRVSCWNGLETYARGGGRRRPGTQLVVRRARRRADGVSRHAGVLPSSLRVQDPYTAAWYPLLSELAKGTRLDVFA